MMEAILSSEALVLKRATWRNIPENGILHSHRSENFKSYIEKRSIVVGISPSALRMEADPVPETFCYLNFRI
jgi:hypothetical protein